MGGRAMSEPAMHTPTSEAHSGERRKMTRLLAILVVLWVVSCIAGLVIGAAIRSARAPEPLTAFAPPHDLAARPLPASETAQDLLQETFGGFARESASPDRTLSVLDLAAVSTASARYAQSAEGVVDVTAARMASAEDATFALRTLKDAASENGSLGNFALGLGEVSYVTYRIGEASALAWAHGGWVFVVSGSQIADVDAFVKTFPY